MYGSHRNSEAAQRSQERRRREDEAPRLAREVPRLVSLVMEIADSEQGALGGGDYIRRVVVESAPALFELVCANKACKNGGHDLTQEIMYSLRAGVARFEGKDACHGTVGSAACANSLTYVAKATYRP